MLEIGECSRKGMFEIGNARDRGMLEIGVGECSRFKLRERRFTESNKKNKRKTNKSITTKQNKIQQVIFF